MGNSLARVALPRVAADRDLFVNDGAEKQDEAEDAERRMNLPWRIESRALGRTTAALARAGDRPRGPFRYYSSQHCRSGASGFRDARQRVAVPADEVPHAVLNGVGRLTVFRL
jgi:hypothetical protein